MGDNEEILGPGLFRHTVSCSRRKGGAPPAAELREDTDRAVLFDATYNPKISLRAAPVQSIIESRGK